MMPVGPILLAILAALTAAGFFDRLLTLLKLSPKSAFLTLLAMLFGSTFNLSLAPGLTLNVGSGLVPSVVAIRLLLTADEWFEPLRATGAVLVTGAGVYILWGWFPPTHPTELNLFYLDAHYLAGLIAGGVGYIAGRSRRAAFCAGVLGVLAGDLAYWFLVMDGAGTLLLGGGGFQGTPVVAGVLAMLLADLVSEAVA